MKERNDSLRKLTDNSTQEQLSSILDDSSTCLFNEVRHQNTVPLELGLEANLSKTLLLIKQKSIFTLL